MSVDFDDQIRSVLADARNRAPAPLAWSDVLERTASPVQARPRSGRALFATASGLVLLLIVGLTVLVRRDAGVDTSSTPSPSTVTSTFPAESLAETFPASGAAEATRDSIKAMLVEDGWTDIGGDHDVAGSATFGVERPDGTVVTGSVLFGATEPIGDTTITGSTVVSGREIIIVGETSAFATCSEVGITIRADTAETSLELLTQALEQLDCP